MDINIKSNKELSLSKEKLTSFFSNLKYYNNKNQLKFKSNGNNQVVVKGDNYYYKIYSDDSIYGWFLKKIRKAFEKVYQSLGIDWEVNFIEEGNNIYTIEKRQILDVYKNSNSMSLILKKYTSVLEMVEKELQLNVIEKQLKKYFPTLFKIKLVRRSINKPIDYANFNDYSILLDDADFDLCMVDQDSNLITFGYPYIEIIYPGMTGLYIYSKKVFDVERTFEPSTYLWVSDISEKSINKIICDIMGYREACLQDTISLLMGRKDKLEYDTTKMRTNFKKKIKDDLHNSLQLSKNK